MSMLAKTTTGSHLKSATWPKVVHPLWSYFDGQHLLANEDLETEEARHYLHIKFAGRLVLQYA